MQIKITPTATMLRNLACLFTAAGLLFSSPMVTGANAGPSDKTEIKRTYKTTKLGQRKIRKAKIRRYKKLHHASKRKTTRSLVRRTSRRATVGKSARGLNPRLRALLTKVRRHYGRPVIITSGCRSHRHNRRIGGARRSMHLQCKAADIKVSGVSKAALRRYVSRLPGRGGVGSYCRNSSIHLDVGPRRSWYWGCGKKRRKARSRRAKRA